MSREEDVRRAGELHHQAGRPGRDSRTAGVDGGRRLL